MRRLLSILSLVSTSMFSTLALASLAPSERVFSLPERQVFALKFIDTTAGELELETLEPTTWQKRPALHFRATVRTVGFFKWIYPFTQIADIYFDRERAVPLQVAVDIEDRGKKQRTTIRLDNASLRGEEIEDTVEAGRPPSHRRKAWSISPASQSIFTVLHFLRLQQLAPGAKIEFPVAHDEKAGVFRAQVIRTEKIPVPRDGPQNALVVRVEQDFASKFRASIKDAPLLWLSDDGSKRLLRFEFKHRRGKVFAVLKTPLSS